jgi:hypothetical protein
MSKINNESEQALAFMEEASKNRKKRMNAATAMFFTGILLTLIMFVIKDYEPVAQFYTENTFIYISLMVILSAIFEIPGFIYFAYYFLSE